jgi:small subunit ribosomal protein S3Ae
LENVLIRKVKVLKKPKFDLTKLMELYSTKADVPAATPTTEEAQNLLSKQ